MCFFATLGVCGEKNSAAIPSRVTVQWDSQSFALKLTGVANRQMLGRNVYLVSSYCEQDPSLTTPENVLAFQGMKQLRIRMLKQLPSSVIAHMIRRSFDFCDKENHLGDEFKRIEDYIGSHTIEVGHTILLTSLAGKGVSCRVHEHEPIVIEKPAVAHVIWTIYFGDPPYHGEAMRRKLTRLLTK